VTPSRSNDARTAWTFLTDEKLAARRLRSNFSRIEASTPFTTTW